MSHYPWWRGAVIYQIYPRSFLDANGDGVGDLPGIIERLDHIAALGVDAIWISPFFKSPMADFGYDIADYRDVDPLFGSLDDFDRLLAKAHGLGLKVMIDQVLSHTSIEHAWFRESRQDRSNPKADWYVWADPREDGTPPNNWLSLFGGCAWQWEPRREQYYLHNFLVDQPDLNFHHPDVQQATLDNVRFWLDRGVDGFRLDAINFVSTTHSCATTRPSRRRSGWGAASARTTRTLTSTTTTTTPSQRTCRSWSACARCWMSIRGRSAWARSLRRIRWRPPPSTPAKAACTWVTASSCWWMTTARPTSATRSRGWKRR